MHITNTYIYIYIYVINYKLEAPMIKHNNKGAEKIQCCNYKYKYMIVTCNL